MRKGSKIINQMFFVSLQNWGAKVSGLTFVKERVGSNGEDFPETLRPNAWIKGNLLFERVEQLLVDDTDLSVGYSLITSKGEGEAYWRMKTDI